MRPVCVTRSASGSWARHGRADRGRWQYRGSAEPRTELCVVRSSSQRATRRAGVCASSQNLFVVANATSWALMTGLTRAASECLSIGGEPDREPVTARGAADSDGPNGDDGRRSLLGPWLRRELTLSGVSITGRACSRIHGAIAIRCMVFLGVRASRTSPESTAAPESPAGHGELGCVGFFDAYGGLGRTREPLDCLCVRERIAYSETSSRPAGGAADALHCLADDTYTASSQRMLDKVSLCAHASNNNIAITVV